jgi:glycosyltransferase involved in cell wall biosynthesis
MPSTDVNEYCQSAATPGEYLLIVGNSFAHKAVRETVEDIRAGLPSVKLRVLGIRIPEFPGISSFASGMLSPELVRNLFSNAKAVVFPSHYEGFGFPVMHALGNRKPVFARDLPVYEEIRQRVAAPQNLHIFSSSEQLIKLLSSQATGWDNKSQDVGDVGWNRTARELEAALVQALKVATFEGIASRLRQLDLLKDAAGKSETRIAQLEAQLEGFQSSTSWRLTAPLRKLKMLFSS